MICPYCNKEMVNGVIRSGRDNAVFIADDAKKTFGIFSKGIKLTGVFDDKVTSAQCKDCNKIIIDLNRIE